MLQTHSDLGAAMGELQIRLQDAASKLAASESRAAELEGNLAACKQELEFMRTASAAVGGQQSSLEERAAGLQKEVGVHLHLTIDVGESLTRCAGQVDECRKGRELIGTKLQSALRDQMALVERVQQLEAEKSSLEVVAAAVGAREAEITTLRAQLAAAEAALASATTSPVALGPAAPSADAAVDKAVAAAVGGGWGAAAEKLDSLMELLGVAPEGDRVGRATRACERARELRSGASRAADRVRQLEAWRAEQVY
jgi:predicted nuclease with TOPRIM domain